MGRIYIDQSRGTIGVRYPPYRQPRNAPYCLALGAVGVVEAQYAYCFDRPLPRPKSQAT